MCGASSRIGSKQASESELPTHYLAVYGTLKPGKPNHHVVADIPGVWLDGVVRGKLYETGWGAAMGYPAIRLDPNGDVIPVKVLHSTDLPDHWKLLDEFEGEEYRWTPVDVELNSGRTITASIYAAVG